MKGVVGTGIIISLGVAGGISVTLAPKGTETAARVVVVGMGVMETVGGVLGAGMGVTMGALFSSSVTNICLEGVVESMLLDRPAFTGALLCAIFRSSRTLAALALEENAVTGEKG